MKKIFALAFALVLAFSLFASAETSEEIDYVSIEGIVTEITETYFILDTTAHGEVQVNVNEETFFSEEIPFAAGQYAFVTYDGMMTRSLPAQINAIAVNVSRFIGTVIYVDEEPNVLLVTSPVLGDVIVYLPETDSAVNYAEGDLVMIYNNGAMTMSLPPQVGGALVIRIETVTGVITEVGEGYAVIEEHGNIYQVNYAPDTTITVDSVEIAVGQVMTVIYNGMMSRSIPAQISAIEITVEAVGVVE